MCSGQSIIPGTQENEVEVYSQPEKFKVTLFQKERKEGRKRGKRGGRQRERKERERKNGREGREKYVKEGEKQKKKGR